MIQIDEYMEPIEIADVLCTATVDVTLTGGKAEMLARKAAGEPLTETVNAFDPEQLAEIGQYLQTYAAFHGCEKIQ